FFQAEDGIRDFHVTGVQTCALPILAQVEYKLRRMVNDYLQPPKVTKKMEIGLTRFAEIERDLDQLKAHNPHELMRALEVSVIREIGRASCREGGESWGGLVAVTREG